MFEVPNDTRSGYRVPNVENLRIINTNFLGSCSGYCYVGETATTTKN
ncbi:hypothetical protein KCP70_23005 [Salmonella enterica subsp. enterica]|nr:hypothetical protein KCP70_23005 [Salmonella enterica subsp. enterica]